MIDVLKLIGRVVWTVLRMILIITMALVLGGFRGAAKSRPPRTGGGN